MSMAHLMATRRGDTDADHAATASLAAAVVNRGSGSSSGGGGAPTAIGIGNRHGGNISGFSAQPAGFPAGGGQQQQSRGRDGRPGVVNTDDGSDDGIPAIPADNRMEAARQMTQNLVAMVSAVQPSRHTHQPQSQPQQYHHHQQQQPNQQQQQLFRSTSDRTTTAHSAVAAAGESVGLGGGGNASSESPLHSLSLLSAR